MTFRQQVVAMHRTIFQRNQRRINESVFGYTASFQTYEREYARGVRRYQRRASFAELDRALEVARVAFVGDYHTLAQAQRSFLRLLRRLPATRPVTIALEMLRARYQKAVDAFLANRITERSFLHEIKHDPQSVFGDWSNFSEIFALAKRRGYHIIGIDQAGRGPAGSSLARRDLFAARVLARNMVQRPDHLVLVLVGELHVAPCHLPSRLQELLADRGDVLQPLIIYQNCPELYLRLEEKGLEQVTPLIRVAPRQYCMMNTPPVVCQLSFLNWLSLDEETLRLETPEQSFREYARLVAAFFDIELGDSVDEVEVATVVDLSFLARLRRRGDFSVADMRQIRRQVLSSESYYIPRAKMVYLGNLSVNHAAEEATHFVRHVCAGSVEPKLLVDAFYARCLEEAVGFLGSKLINHKRKGPSLAVLERQARSRSATPQDRQMARLLGKHLRMEQGKRVRGMSEVYGCDIDAFNAITHLLGYRLGERLYYGLVAGQIDKLEIRDLFHDPFDEEGVPLATYVYLSHRAANVQVPDRL